MRRLAVGLSVVVACAVAAAAQQPKSGVVLGSLSWQDAEPVLTPATVVVVPLGAASVAHGPHLRLDNDERLVRHLADRVRAAADVVIAPPLTYHFDPAFLEYPGSTSLSQNTARDMTVEIVRSLSKYGPRRFYVLNTGTAALAALKQAADALADQGILLGYTDMRYRLLNAPVARQQAPPRGLPHADEIETSMMLYVDPAAVNMSRAVREYPQGTGALTRQKDGPGMYSPSGVVGDPTVATREKGQVFVQAVVAGALEDIAAIRTAPLPIAKAASPAPAPPRAAAPRPSGDGPLRPSGCTEGDERDIRSFNSKFGYWWTQMDAKELAALFTSFGDMRHPDTTIERGREVLMANRLELFRRPEYRDSKHTLTLADIRCVGPEVAIADGKWTLRMSDATETSGRGRRGLGAGRMHSGLCTLIFLKKEGVWLIEAWRYTVDPANGEPPPTTLKQPGFLGRGGG